MIDKKQKILRFLKKEILASTSKVAFEIRSNVWMAKRYLEELEKENIIVRSQTPNSIYWRLKR